MIALRHAGLPILLATAVPGCQTPDPARVDATAESRPAAETPATTPTQPGEDAFATIGDTTISRAAFQARFETRRAWYERGGRHMSPADEARWRARVTDQLLYEEALRLECARLGVDHDPEDLARRQEARETAGLDPERYLAHTGESAESLRARDIAYLRESLLLDRPGAVPGPTDAQIRAEYEKIVRYYDPKKRYRTASLVRIWRGDRANRAHGGAHEAAMDVYRAATEPGADFAALAAPFLADDRDDGRGFVGRLLAEDEAHMPRAVLRKAFSLDAGQVSRPFAVGDWVFVVRVDGVHGRGTPGPDALDRRVRSILSRRLRAEARDRLERDLLARYHAAVVDDRT